MLLCEALEIGPREIISFCGGGGKTSAIQILCKELSSKKRSVISTVTTRIGSNQTDGIAPTLIGAATVLSASQRQQIKDQINNKWALVAGVAKDTKLTGITPQAVCELGALADCVLIEADGSRSLPIKAPAEHEPVIATCTTITVVVVGIDAIGRKILPDEVHRPEQICRLTGKSFGDEIDAEIVAKLVIDPKGLFKGVPATARKFLMLNKVSAARHTTAARNVIAAIRNLHCDMPIIIADTRASESPVLNKIVD